MIDSKDCLDVPSSDSYHRHSLFCHHRCRANPRCLSFGSLRCYRILGKRVGKATMSLYSGLRVIEKQKSLIHTCSQVLTRTHTHLTVPVIRWQCEQGLVDFSECRNGHIKSRAGLSTRNGLGDKLNR